MIIDADGHTQIPQEVFDKYLDKEFYRNRPRFVTFDDGRGFYLIEGRRYYEALRLGSRHAGQHRQLDSHVGGQRSRSQQRSRAGWRISISKASNSR